MLRVATAVPGGEILCPKPFQVFANFVAAMFSDFSP